MSNLDLALSVALGIGLAAATGFRLFLPLLILSGAAYTGYTIRSLARGSRRPNEQ